MAVALIYAQGLQGVFLATSTTNTRAFRRTTAGHLVSVAIRPEDVSGDTRTTHGTVGVSVKPNASRHTLSDPLTLLISPRCFLGWPGWLAGWLALSVGAVLSLAGRCDSSPDLCMSQQRSFLIHQEGPTK